MEILALTAIVTKNYLCWKWQLSIFKDPNKIFAFSEEQKKTPKPLFLVV